MTFSEDEEKQAADEPQGRIAAYINEADNACESGDAVRGVHLYLAAFGYATHVSSVPNENAIVGLKRAWSVACALKERALAEYIFEKMEPYLSSMEATHCANQLQSLALEKLAEFGLSREAIAKMTGMDPSVSLEPGSFKLVHLSTVHQPKDASLNPENVTDGSASPSNSAIADRAGDFEDDGHSLEDSLLKELDEVFSTIDDGGQTPFSTENPDAVKSEQSLGDSADISLIPSVIEGLDDLSLEEKFSNALGAALESIEELQEAATHSEGASAGDDEASEAVFEEQQALCDYIAKDNEKSAINGSSERELPFGEDIQDENSSRENDEQAPLDGEWDPTALPSLTEDGLSLGPGFGLRANPKAEDPEGMEFEQMLKTLGVMMDGFDTRTGEKITDPSQVQGNLSQTDARQQEVKLITYADLVGYTQAIKTMQTFGIGVRDDPDYLILVEALNQLHGMDKMPATDALLFRSLAREDASRFMEATANELDLPLLRLGMDENMQGAFMLCLTVRTDKPPVMNRQRTSFEGPAILCLEDIDMWMSPMDYEDEDGSTWIQRLTKGARDTIQLIRNAVLDPNVYVMATMSSYGEIDPFFCDILTPFSVIDIDVPNEFERADIWRDLVREHPSLADLSLSELIKYSANMPRADIYTAAREALEEAYKQSLSMRTYLPVTYDNLLEKLSAYQPVDSEEYKNLEERVALSLRGELDAFSSVDALLGLDEYSEPKPDQDKPLFDSSVKIDTDNPFFAL